MSIAKRVVGKPTTVLIIFALILGMGIYTVLQIPIDLFPDIKFPMLVVFTSYEGAGPEQVEKTVTRPLEGALSNVSSMKEISSNSSKGTSMIMMEFDWGEDLSEASNEVRDKLELIKRYLPDEAETPQIFKFDPSMMPIMEVSLQGNRPPEELFELAESQVVPYLEQVAGVAQAQIYGGREKIVKVQIPQNRLEAYGISLTQVSQMLAAQNMQMGSGEVYEGLKSYLVQTTGEYSTIDEIGRTVVAYKGGVRMPGQPIDPSKVILLRDIATVEEAYKDDIQSVFINGDPGLDISVMKQSGMNSVQTSNNVHARLKKIKEGLPPDVKLEVIYDTTDMIRDTLKQVTKTALMGALLAMAVLFIFLRNLKSTIIIGLSIPISLIITLMLMYFFNLTLNLMTMAGLTLGIGMIVDSSIVILENIFRYREKGTKLVPSAVLGTQEMIAAISASTLTTVVIFVPIIVFKRELDMIGVLFQDLALTIIVSLLASLVVAMTLVPVLASKYLKIYSRKQRPVTIPGFKQIDNVLEKFFQAMEKGYGKLLGFLLKNKGKSIALVVLLFILSLSMIPFLGMDFMPSSGEPFVDLTVKLPIGSRIENTEKILSDMVNIIESEVKGYKQIIVVSGRGGGFFGGEQANQGQVTITLPDFEERIMDKEQIEETLRAHFDEYPGVNFSFGGGMNSLGSQHPIDIILKCEDLDLAAEKGEEIVKILEENVSVITEPFVDLEDALPLVEVVVDREKAYALGLNIFSIGNEINAAIDGQVATKFRFDGNEYDVSIELPQEDRNSIPDLNNIFVMNSMGQKVTVSSFASMKKSSGPTTIRREDRTRAIHVLAGLKPGISTNVANTAVRDAIAKEYVNDDRVIMQYSGDFEELMKYMFKFVFIMLLAVALVFGVMASQFESMKDPFIVFLSMPFLVVGIVMLHAITGVTISIFTAVGLVMLVGIVVNNGIVLVDYTNLLRARGESIHDACVNAGSNRLRPVLMTTLTTILGILPMAFAVGEGTDLVQPIGQAIFGGLTLSTLFTLFIVPVLYAVFNRKGIPKKLSLKRINRLVERVGEKQELKDQLLEFYHEKGRKLKRNRDISDDNRAVVFSLLVELEYTHRYKRLRLRLMHI